VAIEPLIALSRGVASGSRRTSTSASMRGPAAPEHAPAVKIAAARSLRRAAVMIDFSFPRLARAGAPVAVAMALGAVGCAPGTPGELHHGGFIYTCDGASDPSCDAVENTIEVRGSDPIPGRLAVGSSFQLAWYARDDEGAGARIVAAAPDMIDASEPFFHLKQPGRVSLLARTGDGTVADLVHVDAEVPDAIGFDVTDVELSSEGDTQSVRAVPKHGDAELAGALPCSWSVGDAAVAEIASDPEDNTVTVRANGPGATTLHLQLGDLSYDVPVTVKGGQL
jgi:hypothetical protein